MAYKFIVNPESIKRQFAIYLVLAKSSANTKIYVGKTGDNREGCNPVISRCGNHFSYNTKHSQIRNKILDHENRKYTYIFEHFDDYNGKPDHRRNAINRINEMERLLNEKVQEAILGRMDCELLNPFHGNGCISKIEQRQRDGFRTLEAYQKVRAIVNELIQELQENVPVQH